MAISRWEYGYMVGRCRLTIKLANYGGKPRKSLEVTGEGQLGRPSVARGRPIQFMKAGTVDSKELKVLIPSSQLEEELKLDGIKFHKIFPFGGKKVLIHFFSLDDLELCLEGSFSSISRRLSSCHRWKEEVPTRLRSVWLSIIGLPFKAWSEDNFQKIAEPFGYYLKTELRDFQEFGLERVRVLVETKRLDKIFEVFEAVVRGKVVEAVIYEECFFNGRETEWKVEEEQNEGKEVFLYSSLNEGQSCKGWYQCVVKHDGARDRVSKQGGVRDGATDEELSRQDSSEAKSVSFGGKEETCESSLVRSADEDKEDGKTSSVREVSGCSWDATLKSFCSSKEKGARGRRKKIIWGQDVDASVESISSEEVVVRRLVSMKGASKSCKKKKIKGECSKQGSKKEEVGSARSSQKSYLEELEKSSSSNQDPVVENHLEVEKVGMNEEARKLKQRKEAEDTYLISLELGVKGSLPEEEMIQFFENKLQREYEERRW
ncbi:hypothetical protein QQ045_027959 [Rhodiola kirilowii]